MGRLQTAYRRRAYVPRMPYSRLNFGRRLVQRGDGYGNAGPYASGVTGNTRHTFARGVRELALYVPPTRAPKGEMHYFDTEPGGLGMDTTGTITALNIVAQGDALTQRTGSRYTQLGLQIRGYVQSGTATTITMTAFLIVWDRQPQGALPAITDILDTADSRSFQRADNRDRFHVLLRRDYVLMGPAGTPTSASIKNVDEFIKFRRQTVLAGGDTTGVVANMKTGGLYLVTVGVAPAGATAGTMNARFRLHFADSP